MQHPFTGKKYFELLWQYTKRGIVTRYKGSYLGALWPVLTPLLMLGLYVFVFGFIFGGSFKEPKEPPVEFALALFVGLSLVQFIGEILGASPRAILNAPNLVKKVVFPLPILPLSGVGIALFNYLIPSLLVFIGVAVWGGGLTWTMFYWPIVILPTVLMGTGIAFFLSAIGVFLRDIAQLTGFLINIIMYASAVFFPLAKVRSTEFWVFLKFNPILHAIDLARDVVVWNVIPPVRTLLFLYGFSTVTLLIGWFFFKKLKPAFADVL